MKNADLKKLAEDLSLNSDARSVVLFVATRGTGFHEISNDDFRVVPNHCSERKAMDSVNLAVRSGWIEKTKGGWGSPNSYQFRGPTDLSKNSRTEEDPDLLQKDGTGESLSIQNATGQGTDLSKNGRSTRAREVRKRERVVDREIEDRGGVGGDGGDGPYEIDSRVRETLEGERWSGFRNSLLDYFRDRVRTEKQWGYLMTVQTWFDGAPAGPKGFFNLTKKDQRLMIASCVNELLAETADQERKNYRSSRGEAGSTHTLRTKLEYNLRRREWSQAKAGKTDGKDPSEEQYEITIGDPDSFFPEDMEEQNG